MKKIFTTKSLLIASNIGFIVLSTFLFFKGNNEPDKNLNSAYAVPENFASSQESPIIVDTSRNCDPCLTSSGNQFHYMDGDLLRRMARDYRSHYQKKITNAYSASARIDSITDASSIWFSLDSLKRFIGEIEYNVCKNKKGPGKLELGIRIYYAKYPSTGALSPYKDLKDVPPEFENVHTVFMVPTFDKIIDVGKLQHVDFAPQYELSPAGEPITIEALQKDPVKFKQLLIMGVNSGRYPALNHGGVCPPACDTRGLAFGN